MLSCYQDFSSLDKEKATKLLISAIHQTDEVSPSLLDASLPYHIKVATDRKLVSLILSLTIRAVFHRIEICS